MKTILNLFCALAITGASLTISRAQTPAPAPGAFSFAAYGDSRPMMNIPSKYGRPEVNKLLAESFGIVVSEKVAEA